MSETGSDSLQGHIDQEGRQLNHTIAERAKQLVDFDKSLQQEKSNIRPRSEHEAAVNFVMRDFPDLPGFTFTSGKFSIDNEPTETVWRVGIFEDPQDTGGGDFPTVELKLKTDSQNGPTYTLSGKTEKEEIPDKLKQLRNDNLKTAADILAAKAKAARYAYEPPEELTEESIQRKLNETMSMNGPTPKEWLDKNVREKVAPLLAANDLYKTLEQLPTNGKASVEVIDGFSKFQEFVMASKHTGEHSAWPN